jgi:hypothetical protein
VALVLLVAGAAAGPIRPVAEKGDTQYVFVKLLFEGAFVRSCRLADRPDSGDLFLGTCGRSP